MTVFNPIPGVATQQLTGLRGADVARHPVLWTSADEVLRTATIDAATGTFTVPARSVAVSYGSSTAVAGPLTR